MRSIRKKGLAVAAVSALALGLLIPAGTAQADVAPSGSDIVGVGSDTLQYMIDFGVDGDDNGHAGYNAGKSARVVSIDATPDANARSGYLNGSTNSVLLPLNPTVILRAGTQPVQRPNGSGAGLSAIEADPGTGASETINFVRSSSAYTSGSTGTTLTGPIDVVKLATENLSIAVANTSNMPSGGLSKAQLFNIYECDGHTGGTPTEWSDVGGTSSDQIIPIIPQAGSGTRKTFLTDIGFTNITSSGGSTPALGSCVRTDEENNPYAFYLSNEVGGVASSVTPDADPYATSANVSPDAIAPFSGARLSLYNSGYFLNPNVTFNGPVLAGDEDTLNPLIHQVLTGSPSDSNPVYVDNRGLYVFFRDSDLSSTAHFNGSTQNWVKTLFYDPGGPTPYFESAAGQTDMASAGVTPNYAYCGSDPTVAC